jgi:hypothetical protein
MNGHINIGNIGWYLLQAQEGNLNAQEMEALCSFLEAHPELVPDTETLLSTAEDDTSSRSFSHLKKEDFELGAFDMLAVSVLEGERHEHDLNEITSERADLQKQWRAFKYTVLKPENALMPNKDKLYQKRTQYVWIRYAAAACLAALFLGMGWMVFKNGSEKPQLVNVNTIPVNEDLPQVKAKMLISSEDDAPNLAVSKPLIKDQIRDTTKITEISKRQERFIEHIEPIKHVQLESEVPQLMLAQNMPYSISITQPNVAQNTQRSDEANRWPRFLRNLLPGNSKPQNAPQFDWVDLLASAGNQGLDQISKGRIEFSYQPERDNGPEAVLKIGNFSISRSIASN